MQFEGKVALVTGSGRGSGRAIALRLAQGGADVAVNFYRNRKPAEDTAAEIAGMGRKATVVKAHVGRAEGIEHLLDEVLSQHGGVDILVCNAATGYNRPVLEQRLKGWDWTMNTNARSALLASQRAAAVMKARGGGHIITISSPGSSSVMPDYSVVGASKAALEALTRYLAVELAPLGIVVNGVSPGVVDTGALDHFQLSRETDFLKKAAAATPAGRVVTPQDVAAVVAFLCSEEAEMIRGQVIAVDGGTTLPLGPMTYA